PPPQDGDVEEGGAAEKAVGDAQAPVHEESNVDIEDNDGGDAPGAPSTDQDSGVVGENSSHDGEENPNNQHPRTNGSSDQTEESQHKSSAANNTATESEDNTADQQDSSSQQNEPTAGQDAPHSAPGENENGTTSEVNSSAPAAPSSHVEETENKQHQEKTTAQRRIEAQARLYQPQEPAYLDLSKIPFRDRYAVQIMAPEEWLRPIDRRRVPADVGDGLDPIGRFGPDNLCVAGFVGGKLDRLARLSASNSVKEDATGKEHEPLYHASSPNPASWSVCPVDTRRCPDRSWDFCSPTKWAEKSAES
ncbi:unnamed protein product, partial [Amoebophrya sp. A25]